MIIGYGNPSRRTHTLNHKPRVTLPSPKSDTGRGGSLLRQRLLVDRRGADRPVNPASWALEPKP